MRQKVANLPVNRLTHDLILTIKPASSPDAGYLVTLDYHANTRESQQDHSPAFDLGDLETKYLRSLHDFVAAPPAPEMLRNLGRTLASSLLPANVRGLLMSILARDFTSTLPIRLRLKIDPPELVDIPWELVFIDPIRHLSGITGFLGLNSRFRLVRQTTSLLPAEAAPVETVRVLIAWANPCSSFYPVLPHAREEAELLHEALQSRDGFHIEAEVLPNATPDTLQAAIKDLQPHLLHFIGHGEAKDGGMLVLEGANHSDQTYVSGSDLATWLSGIDVRLVTLSACRTSGVATTLIKSGVGAVLAMQLPWRDEAAIPFFATFYDALLKPQHVEQALQAGRQALRHRSPDWAVPVLYLSRDTDTLFVPQTVYCKLPYFQNPNFRGRDRELAVLHQRLMASPPQPVALVGLGGMGKSQLASEYAHQYRAAYPGGIFWIDARDSQRMRDKFAEISVSFGVPESWSPEYRAQQMILKLQELKQPALVIYDNVTDKTEIDLKPTVGNCRILATARAEYNVRAASFHPIALNALADDAAWALLQTRRQAKNEAELAAVRAIATMLGNLPLGLMLVAARVDLPTVGANDRPFANYLRRLKLNPKKELDRPRGEFKAFTNYDGAFFDTIEISYRDLSATARNVLTIASLFAARSIPPDLLMAASGMDDSDEFDEALGELARYSLITLEEQGSLSIHEIVRFFVRPYEQEDFCRALDTVARVLTTNLERSNRAFDWRTVRSNISHCRTVIDLCQAQPAVPHYVDLLRELGAYYFEQGDYAEAESQLTIGRALAEQRHGLQHEDVATFLRHLGGVRQAQGEHARDRGEHAIAEVLFTEARRCREQALEIAQTLYGLEGAKTVDYYNDLGYVMDRQGAPVIAEKYYLKALEITLKVHGPWHEEVASGLNNLGVLYEVQNRFDEALTRLHRSRCIMRRLFGIRQTRFTYRVIHFRYAAYMNNIGRILGKQGKHRISLARHMAALSVFMELYADLVNGHRHLAFTYRYIAEANRLLDRRGEARHYYELALPILIRLLGSSHVVCQDVMSKLKALYDDNSGEL